MSTTKAIISSGEESMKKSIERLEQELNKVRAGKASPAMLEGLRVDYYGSSTPITQVANVSAPDARTLTIQPYERNLIPAIEKAINEANLGINPQNDGILVRLNLPVQTEERRKQLVKQAKEISEEAKVRVRNVRQESNTNLKKLTKDGVSEDEVKIAEAEVQKLTDKYIAIVEKHFADKEKEIMTV